MNNEIIIYQPDKELKKNEVRIDKETVWLNRRQIAVLFDRDIKTIGKHINKALKEELAGTSTVAKFATVQKEGNRLVENIDFYKKVVYHFGASLKDLGKKWFAFSKMEMDAEIILRQLNNNLNGLKYE